MKKINWLLLTMLAFCVVSCRAVQPILVLHPSDFFWYAVTAAVLSIIVSITTNRSFWLWFLINIIITPVGGVLVWLYLDTKKNKDNPVS